MVLLCYDGSADAQAAIDSCTRLMPGADATVLVIWETLFETMTRTGALGMGMGTIGAYGGDDLDPSIEKAALETATDGAQRATAAGLIARPRTEEMNSGDTAQVILAVAASVDADLIALGTRGRSVVKSLMLGSVSSAVVHHADRAVLVVPSPALVERRRA